MFLSYDLSSMTEDDVKDDVQEIIINDLNNPEGIYYLEDINFVDCSDCNLQFESENDLRLHLKENHKRNYKEVSTTRPECPQCSISFSRRNNLLRHLKKFHQLCIPRVVYDESRIHKCPACNAKFTRKSNLLRHTRKFHEFLVSKIVRHSPKLFACPECNTGFTKWSNCKRHIKHFHSDDMFLLEHSDSKMSVNECDINREVSVVVDVEEDVLIHEYVEDLKEHVVLPCSDCDLMFSKSQELQEHIETVHSISLLPDASEMETCPLCSYHDTKANLYLHFTSVHDCPILIEGQEFKSIEEFHQWLKFTQTETSSKFVELPTKKMKFETSSKQVFVCSRTKENKLKSEGGGFCPAEITLISSPNKCEIYFIKTHIGHDNETEAEF